MSNEVSLSEYIAQSQRAQGGRLSGSLGSYLYGPDSFKKAALTGTYASMTTAFTATYGKKVWDSMNNKAVTFNALKKVDWGPTVGWRLRTARTTGSSRSGPVTETGALPAIDISNYIGVSANPKQIASTFGVSLKSQAVTGLEGGVGNMFAVEQEACSRDHIKEINQELMAGSAYPVVSGSTSTAVVGGAGSGSHNPSTYYRIGDVLGLWISGSSYDATNLTISAIVPSTGTITGTGWSTGPSQSSVIYPISRNGMTSLDDVCMCDSTASDGPGGGRAKSLIYSLTTRTNGTYAAPATSMTSMYNVGVGRPLSLSLVDNGFKAIRQNGGEPKLMVTGLDQYDRFNQLLQTQQRFVDVTDYIVGVGDERTYPGTRAGFQLATYRGVPILPDPDTAVSTAATASSDNALLGSNFYTLDTDYIEIAVMYPTQYIENRDYMSINSLVMRGLFLTVMEMRCLRPDCQYAIRDLSA